MELDGLRDKINDLDEQIVKLFVERMQVSAKIAEIKAETNLPVLDQRRENVVLKRVMEMAGVEFVDFAKTLYQTIFYVSRTYQSGILIK